jgi:uncharacterized protein (DUF488 family)|tara:strand:+ start:6383 stop:7018 length:636 start_codon:yes stop_codon:yes gene_type:complete
MTTFYTIGHSNREPQTVVIMLKDAGVSFVADVRAFPRSRSNPTFNVDVFPDFLKDQGITYRHFPRLGGRRKKQPGVGDALNAFWRVQSFHNYADYALSPEFQSALRELEDLGADLAVALMCSEAVWWRCHRRLITDYLLARGHKVVHLMVPGREQDAVLSEGAVVQPDCDIHYPDTTGTEESSAQPHQPAPLCLCEKLAYRENPARALHQG